jgi:hypothetical protein
LHHETYRLVCIFLLGHWIVYVSVILWSNEVNNQIPLTNVSFLFRLQCDIAKLSLNSVLPTPLVYYWLDHLAVEKHYLQRYLHIVDLVLF